MKQRNWFRGFVLGCVCCLMLTVFSASAWAAADAYPSKPIRLVLALAPGSGTESFTRVVLSELSKRLGQPMIVEHRAGASGVVGLEAAAKSAPDGYTIVLIEDSHIFLPAFGEKLPYDLLKSFTSIGQLGRGYNVLTISPSVPAKNVMELVSLLKEKPGQMLCVASAPGGISHMVAEMFKVKTGTNFKIVHFQGGAQATTDLLGGHSHFGFLGLMNTMTLAQTGKL